MKPTKHTNETNRQKILLKQTKQLPEFNKNDRNDSKETKKFIIG